MPTVAVFPATATHSWDRVYFNELRSIPEPLSDAAAAMRSDELSLCPPRRSGHSSCRRTPYIRSRCLKSDAECPRMPPITSGDGAAACGSSAGILGGVG